MRIPAIAPSFAVPFSAHYNTMNRTGMKIVINETVYEAATAIFWQYDTRGPPGYLSRNDHEKKKI